MPIIFTFQEHPRSGSLDPRSIIPDFQPQPRDLSECPGKAGKMYGGGEVLGGAYKHSFQLIVAFHKYVLMNITIWKKQKPIDLVI